ncbi:hypothetical protein DRN32_00700 [Thermococci archaeon]|nr:MAG: hypothetical protein DRN32_00700 [Thermococci archaeon]
MKRLLLIILLVFSFLPWATASEEGLLVVNSIPRGVQVNIEGIGTFETPFRLSFPAGEYSLRFLGDINATAVVKVYPDEATHVTVNLESLSRLLKNDHVISARVIFNKSANYTVESLKLPFKLSSHGGCGGASPVVHIPSPPMTILVLNGGENREIELLLNNTPIPQRYQGKTTCILHVNIFDKYGHTIGDVKESTFVAPLATVSVTSKPANATVYVFGFHERTVFYTPIILTVPVIPNPVYNVSARTGLNNTITIPYIPQLDEYRIGIGDDHLLVEFILHLKPNDDAPLYVDIDTIKSAFEIKRTFITRATLIVDSTPSNASLIVKGEVFNFTGRTPAVVEVPLGNYTVLAFKGGMGASTSIEVTENKNLNLTLIPEPARIFINSTPPDALIVLNGEKIKNTSLVLPPGEYNLTVEAEGYLSYSTVLVLAPNESRTIFVSLIPKPVLEITTDPEGVNVEIGETRQHCITPCNLTLNPGRYTLTFSKEGYKSYKTLLKISAGDGRIPFRIRLEPLGSSPNPGITQFTKLSTSTPSMNSNAGPSLERTVGVKFGALLFVIGVLIVLLRRGRK